MKQMSLIEMDGFLKGKCIPRDLKVNETNAEYLVRKFAEAEAKCAALAAENTGLKSGAMDEIKVINRGGQAYCVKDGVQVNPMYMTTITKERLLTIKQWRETYGPGSNVVLPAEEAEELARIALASLEQNALSGNSRLIPGEVLSAIREVAKIRADFDDFDGDRRGIGDCLDEAEQELIVTINKYASQLAAEPIATNDVREQQTAVPPVPEIQDDVAQAIENLKQKLVECNRYNYCADAVKGVEDACHAAMLHSAEPASNHEELPLDYLQGQKDGLEWAAQLAEANHPQTGDWLYDDPVELAKAIRKGPDMPEAAGNYPVTPDGWISCSERMPEDTKMLLAFSQGEIVAAYWNWVVNPIDYKKYRAFTYLSGNILDDVTHWMPLPEPPL